MNESYKTIIELIDFFKTGSPGHFLTATITIVDKKTLRVIVINLLAWLKRESKQKMSRPLRLNAEFTWCNTLAELIKNDTAFRSLLVNDNNAISLNPNIPEDEKSQIIAACARAYDPPLMR